MLHTLPAVVPHHFFLISYNAFDLVCLFRVLTRTLGKRKKMLIVMNAAKKYIVLIHMQHHLLGFLNFWLTDEVLYFVSL